MTTFSRVLILMAVAVGAGWGGFWYGQNHAAEEEHATTQPAPAEERVAQVTTTPARLGTISQSLVAYGSVVAQPGEVRVVSVPFESRVGRVLVTPGQQLAAASELLEVNASPDVMVSLQEAKNALEAAQRDLKQTEQRFKDRLATNQELSQAQQALASAKLKLQSLSERGVGAAQRLKTEVAGIVSKVDVQEGQIVPAGGPLVEIAAGNRIEVRLGFEPETLQRLSVEQPVKIMTMSAADAAAVTGKVRLITRKVNPDTRLNDVFVSIPPDNRLMIDQFVRGELVIESKQTLVVPRRSTLVREDGYELYTVSAGHAMKHSVSLGLSNDEDVELINSDLKPGDQVVVIGNAELEEQMAVTEEKQP